MDTDKWLNDSLLDFIPKWLTLDGTTIASQHCSFVSCNKMQLLMFDNNQNQDTICFKSCINLVRNVHARKGFETKWICFPINNGEDHWTFLAVLNMIYLQTAQKDKLTAFLYYNALFKKTSRDDCMKLLQNKGIFNFIICANVMFGKPDGLPKQDLLNFLVSTETFSRIHVYYDDSPLQVDGYNCGVLVCLCMMEIALNLSHKFQKLEDFDIPDGSPKSIKIYDEGDVVFKRGTFFQLFLDRTSSSKKKKGSSQTTKKTTVSRNILADFRKQWKTLLERMFALKGQSVDNSLLQSGKAPKYMRINMRQYAWRFPQNNQNEIDEYQNNFDALGNQLPHLLQSKNPVFFTKLWNGLNPNEEEKKDNEMFSPDQQKALVEAGMMDLETAPPASTGDDTEMDLASAAQSDKSQAISVDLPASEETD